MEMRRYAAMAVAATAMMLQAATTNTWTGAVNDWNWNEGGNFAKGLPAKDDVVEIPSGTVRLFGTNAVSLAVVNSLERIIPLSSDSKLQVETDSDHPVSLSCAVSWPVAKETDAEADYGEVVKTGAGTLTLVNQDLKAYCTSFTVKEGSLRLPTAAATGTAHAYTRLSVSNGATIFTVSNRGYTYVRELLGSGLVTNDSANECNLQIWGGTAEAPVQVEATLAPNLRYYQYGGYVDILSTNNTITSAFAVRRASGTGASMAGLKKLGNGGSVGSPGTYSYLFFTEYGGGFRYLGSGETSTKGLLFVNTDTFAGYGEFDGGPCGGLEFRTTPWSARYGIRKLILSGSNAAPCVVSAPINENTTSATNGITLVKRGTGTWRLAHNVARNGLVGVSVEEGTLQVDSIMEKGELCALGPATNRYPAGWCGGSGAENRVDYALALGGEDAADVPLLELVGTNGAWAVDRATVLFGDARLRNSATNAAGEPLPLRLSGFAAATAGTKRLILEGERAAGYDTLGGIADGAGRVAVVKTGGGTWNLAGTNTFTGGLVVSNGILNILSPSGTYTWYRWNIKKIKNGGGEIRMHEFGLYDADGNRVNGGLARCRNYAAIRRGEAAVQRQMTAYYGEGQETRELYNLFDDRATDRYWYFLDQTPNAKYPAPDDAASWYRVLMCLPEGAAEVASYDVAPVNAGGNVVAVAWSLEASVDGMNWDELHMVDSALYSRDQRWAFANTVNYAAGSAAFHTGGCAIAGSTNKTVRALSPDCPVEVAEGAVLNCVGTAELSNLRVDFAGAGTLSGFAVSDSGTLDVRNVPAGGGTLPVSFAGTDAAEVAKIAGWRNLRVDGAPSGAYRVAASGGKLRLYAAGTVFMVR